MELRPSSEFASSSTTEEFPNILRNQKLHYCAQEPSTGPYPQPDQSGLGTAAIDNNEVNYKFNVNKIA
jgi:hypothetical protein